MNILLSPMSDPGYLYPAIAAGLELRRRRHRVRLLGRADAARTAAAAGLEAAPAEPYGWRSAFSVAGWMGEGAGQYETVRRAARDHGADVIVTSVLCTGALLAAETLDLPVVVLGLTAHLWCYAAGGEAEPESPAVRAWRTRGMLGHYHALREQVGLPARRHRWPDCPLTGTELLLRGHPDLEFPGAVLPPRIRHAGPCDWEPSPDPDEVAEVAAHLDRVGKPVVYVHLGRIFGGTSPWPRLNAAFTGGRFQAVVEQARSRDPAPDPAADILLVRKPWMGPLIARAGLVLTSGTSAPVLGALLRGRPIGLSPAGSEQPLLSAACVRAGVGRYVTNELAPSPAAVLEGAWRDSAARSRSAALGRALRGLDSARRAADAVERAARGWPPPSHLEGPAQGARDPAGRRG